MNSKNSRTSDPHRLLLNLTDKIDLRIKDKYVALSYPSVYYTWMNVKKSTINKNNKFEIPAPTWNEEFKLPDWFYSISHFYHIINIQDYFKYILKNIRKRSFNKNIHKQSRLKLKQDIILNF